MRMDEDVGDNDLVPQRCKYLLGTSPALSTRGCTCLRYPISIILIGSMYLSSD